MSRWVFAVLLFAVGLWLNTRFNQFPYYYHPDESKKVEQVLTGERNFNHPLVLLNSTQTIWKVLGSPQDPQRVAEIGRWICAIFCALGTAFFAQAAWTWRGPFAGMFAGIILTANHQVFELAHYMKEDPALYLGVGLTVWMLIVFARNPDKKNCLFLGCAIGLAVSGKYLGIFMLLPAFAFVLCLDEKQNARRIVYLVMSMIFVFSVINLRLFAELGTFLQSFSKEMDWAVKGQKELTRDVPHAIYLNIFVSNSTPLIWVFLVGFGFEIYRAQRVTPPVVWCLIGTLLGWFILLSFSPKTNDRYFLPLTGLVYFFAAAGADNLLKISQSVSKLRVGLAVLLFTSAVVWDANRTRQFAKAFSIDDRAELTAWILKNIPTTATIAYDARVNLPDEEVHHELLNPLPHRLLRKTYVSDIANVDEVVKNKIDYVVVSESSYGRFFLESLQPKAGELKEYEARAAYYCNLKKRQPLWKRDRGNVLYLHPGLEVYEVAH